MFCNKSNEILLILTPWFDAFGAGMAPWNDVFVNISFDFMQKMIFNRSSIFYQKVMFCNKYNGILPFLPPRSSLFATFSGRFFSILLAGWSFYATGEAFRVFHDFFNVFVNFHKKIGFWCVFRFNIKTNGFLMILSFPRVGKSQFFSFSNFNIKTNGFLMMILNQ